MPTCWHQHEGSEINGNANAADRRESPQWLGLETSFPFIDVVRVDGVRTSAAWVIASSLKHAMVALPCDDELNSNGYKHCYLPIGKYDL